MSATLTTAPSVAPLRAPVRVLLRQHRWTLWIAAGVALLTAIGVVAVAMRSAHVSEVFQATGCQFYGEGETRACMQMSRNFADSMNLYARLFEFVALGLVVLPALLGAFVAGPLIARELESGTFRMAWTQSVSPARWLTARLAVPTAALLAGSAVLAPLLHWARTRGGASPYPVRWSEVYVFPTTGIVLPAYILFAVGAGALVGVLIRRAFVALTVSAVTSGAVAIAFGAYLRPYLWPRTTVSGQGHLGENTWWLESGYLNSNGERVSPPDSCSASSGDTWDRCLTDHGITGSYVDYHPQSHFWPLQLVETGILLALAVLALALAFRVLRRLHG
ncbi:hypothetical protein ACGFYA_10875 [Streptomyces sp. NPDC048305]|uniref:hypothetical protein n=1 Tax=Streptomyces sp. NPDC048305 TaxID=3365532 RepID=UPI00371C94D8